VTILFCFAHPDDESFSGAGTAMRCAAAGAKTVLVTATLGERGKRGDPPVCGEADLPKVREHELRNAAAVIGFDELHLLGYRDRELADAPPKDMRRVLVSHLRRLRPAVVFTFDPNGFNTHPDHIAISRFCSEAIAAAADPRWHPDAGAPHQVRRLLWTPPIAPWDAVALDLPAQPGADFVIDVSAFRKRRISALRAHRTQHQSIDRYFFDRPELDRILDVETWRHAWGPVLTTRPTRDVFDGL
jgi:N-acetylglucosamine malate deacetylase 2